jgi:hypothetical protein
MCWFGLQGGPHTEADSRREHGAQYVSGTQAQQSLGPQAPAAIRLAGVADHPLGIPQRQGALFGRKGARISKTAKRWVGRQEKNAEDNTASGYQ